MFIIFEDGIRYYYLYNLIYVLFKSYGNICINVLYLG